MDDVLRVAVVNRHEQTAHVFGGNSFTESLIRRLRNLGKELDARNILHHQVDVFVVVVRLVVLDDVGVVQRVQNRYFLHDQVHVFTQFLLVEHLDCHLVGRVVDIRRLKNGPEGTGSQLLRLLRNDIVLFEFADSLLLAALLRVDVKLASIVSLARA